MSTDTLAEIAMPLPAAFVLAFALAARPISIPDESTVVFSVLLLFPTPPLPPPLPLLRPPLRPPPLLPSLRPPPEPLPLPRPRPPDTETTLRGLLALTGWPGRMGLVGSVRWVGLVDLFFASTTTATFFPFFACVVVFFFFAVLAPGPSPALFFSPSPLLPHAVISSEEGDKEEHEEEDREDGNDDEEEEDEEGKDEGGRDTAVVWAVEEDAAAAATVASKAAPSLLSASVDQNLLTSFRAENSCSTSGEWRPNRRLRLSRLTWTEESPVRPMHKTPWRQLLRAELLRT